MDKPKNGEEEKLYDNMEEKNPGETIQLIGISNGLRYFMLGKRSEESPQTWTKREYLLKKKI